MKAFRLAALHKLELADIPPPRISASKEVLLRVAAVGVCGSDIHYYKTGRIGSQVVEYPFMVGHEFSATVAAVGAEVTRVAIGERVVVDPALSCGDCDQCRAGRPHTCRNLKFMGCPKQLAGCLCEYVVLPEDCCYPVPESVSLEQAALVEPFSIGCYAVRQSGDIAGRRIGILGAGPIGISVMLAARSEQVGDIYVSEPLEERRALAEEQGACWSGDPRTVDPAAAIAAREPRMLDIVFECCGQQEALDQALEMLAPGGKLILIGIPEVDRVSFSIDELRHREISVINIRRQNGCVQRAIDLIASGQVDIDRMLTHRFPFAQTVAAFDLVENYADGVLKAVIEIAS
jgi:L-iditol 2-dehydrogenase